MYDELVKRLREAPNDWYDADLHYEAADAIELLDMITDNMNYLYKTEVPKWISVTERLPEPNAVDEYGFAKGYLVKTDRHVMIHTARYTGEWWILWGYHKVITDNVTHWMPLPEPPKEDSNA